MSASEIGTLGGCPPGAWRSERAAGETSHSTGAIGAPNLMIESSMAAAMSLAAAILSVRAIPGRSAK
jgi:hypothetical protein